MALRIEDYALVGDTHTGALVGLDGSIDWLCLPRFDSWACFAALLGTADHGRWRIAPVGVDDGAVVATRRRYRGESLVLETEFETATGTVRLVDAMPVRDQQVDVVRLVEGVSGEVEMELRWAVRFLTGSAVPWVRRVHDDAGREVITAVAGPDAVTLRGDVLPSAEGREHVARFVVRAGERTGFHMAWYSSTAALPAAVDITAAVATTEQWWSQWASRCGYDGPYREAVVRSLLTLKALTYAPTGGIVAAATTSLPEDPGGERNWDYRYCWLRDATLTLWSFLSAGYVEEARAWRGWLLRAIAGDPADVQIMYGVAGERHLHEVELPWLPGYEGSVPVRRGNEAYEQFQLDVFGEVMDTLSQARDAGIVEDDFSWPLQRALMTRLEQSWQRTDLGIWEVRGQPRHFTHSRVMAWVAFDRAVRAVEDHGLPGPVERWRELRATLHAEVLERGWNAERGAFTQYYGGTELDAAVLMLPLVGFLPADDPRMTATIAAVEAELREGDLVHRYETTPGDTHAVDGLRGSEGAFLACSFWLVDCLARSGRRDEAVAMFERLLALRNEVGLLAEEYDGRLDRQVGNFPQAFSHLTLVEAAYTLAADAAPREQRGPRHLLGFA